MGYRVGFNWKMEVVNGKKQVVVYKDVSVVESGNTVFDAGFKISTIQPIFGTIEKDNYSFDGTKIVFFIKGEQYWGVNMGGVPYGISFKVNISVNYDIATGKYYINAQ